MYLRRVYIAIYKLLKMLLILLIESLCCCFKAWRETTGKGVLNALFGLGFMDGGVQQKSSMFFVKGRCNAAAFREMGA